MCLYLNSTDQFKVAEENIVCYKIGTLKRIEGVKRLLPFHFPENMPNGYRVGRKAPQVTVSKNARWNMPYPTVHSGYHSYKSIKGGRSYLNQVFVIPKGTKYYEGWVNDWNREGERDGFVSETIIWMGHISNPFTWLRVWNYKRKNK